MTEPDPSEPPKTVADLLAIMAALRTPVTGCPWDLEQDFSTIAPYTIEEAYEVADAIQRGDRASLKDELGDLLLQVVYHARLAEEEGSFAFDDVVDGIARKMVRRHPHVFGDAAPRSAGAAKGFWERAKADERAAHPAAIGSTTLADVPLALPALSRAIKLQNKAAAVGFDWPNLAPVLAKLAEELREFEETIGGEDRKRVAEELGDVLFVLANVARHLEVDPECALRCANNKFTRRFACIEAKLTDRGKTPAQSSLSEMDELWDQAKREERAASGGV